MKPIPRLKYIWPSPAPRLTWRTRWLLWETRHERLLDCACAFVLGMAVGSLAVWWVWL